MPANLSPEYREAEEALRRAKTAQEKLTALEEMLAVIPKHKGTDKLQGEIKKRISKLKNTKEVKTARSQSNRFLVEPQGAGQIPLVGLANTGKSSLLAALTNASPVIADYPFSTGLPEPGMMQVMDTAVQLVDTPPFMEEGIQGELVATLQRADAFMVVADASSDACLDQLTIPLEQLLEKRLVREVEVEAATGGRTVTSEQCLFVVNKCDRPEAQDNLTIIAELFERPDQLVTVSAQTGQGLEQLKQRAFQSLNVIRIYSKVPGQDPDLKAPFTIGRGSTVMDFAEAVHKDFVHTFTGARVWGSARFDGQRVARDYVLEDGDIVELHQKGKSGAT